jgi:hypothetical protein
MLRLGLIDQGVVDLVPVVFGAGVGRCRRRASRSA